MMRERLWDTVAAAFDPREVLADVEDTEVNRNRLRALMYDALVQMVPEGSEPTETALLVAQVYASGLWRIRRESQDATHASQARFASEDEEVRQRSMTLAAAQRAAMVRSEQQAADGLLKMYRAVHRRGVSEEETHVIEFKPRAAG